MNHDVSYRGKFDAVLLKKDGTRIKCGALNGLTNEGKNALLGIMFHAATQITTWYIGIIAREGFASLQNSDTLATHNGWQEFEGYTGDRKEWTEGAPSSQTMTNATSVDFTLTEDADLQGMFLCSAETGNTGTLWATCGFDSVIEAETGDVLQVTYTVSF